MKKIGKAFESILLGLLLLSVASFVFTYMTTRVPTIFGYRLFFVVTDSMEPVYTKGTLLIAIPIKEETLIVNEVYAYRAGQKDIGINPIIVHRLVNINEEDYIFKGDSNTAPDKSVRKEQILYRIIYRFSELLNTRNDTTSTLNFSL